MSFKEFLINNVIKEDITAYRLSKESNVNIEAARRWFNGETLPDRKSSLKIATTYGYDIQTFNLVVAMYNNPPEIRDFLLKTMVIK